MAICPAEKWYAVFKINGEAQDVPVTLWWDMDDMASTVGLVSSLDMRKHTETGQPSNWPHEEGFRLTANAPALVAPHFFNSFIGYRKHE